MERVGTSFGKKKAAEELGDGAANDGDGWPKVVLVKGLPNRDPPARSANDTGFGGFQVLEMNKPQLE